MTWLGDSGNINRNGTAAVTPNLQHASSNSFNTYMIFTVFQHHEWGVVLWLRNSGSPNCRVHTSLYKYGGQTALIVSCHASPPVLRPSSHIAHNKTYVESYYHAKNEAIFREKRKKNMQAVRFKVNGEHDHAKQRRSGFLQRKERCRLLCG